MKSSFKKQLNSNFKNFIVLLITIPLISFSQIKNSKNESLSNNKAHDLVNDFVVATNSGDRAIMQDFILANYDQNILKRIPLFAVVSLNMALYYESGGKGFDLIKVLPNEKNQLSAELLNRLSQTRIRLKIPVSPAPEFKINQFIKSEVISSEAVKNQSNLKESELIFQLEKCLDLMEKDEEFSGTVLLAKNGNPILKRTIGDASKAFEIPNNMDTKFNLASVGKVFTGTAVTQLVEKGKLSFDDPISKYVSEEWLNPEISKKIQIKHLLTHTSGLGDYFTDAYKQNRIPFFRDLDDYKMLIVDDKLAFEPGTKFSYSNTGMLLLGVVIENVTGEKYFNYLKNNIFEPAGMVNSDGFDKDVPVKNRATGYTKVYENGNVSWNNHQFTRIMRGSPSGGIYSTANDLLNFDKAFRSNALLTSKYTELALIGQPQLNSSFHSYAFFVSEGKAGRIASHKGDGRGMNCQFKMYLDSGYTVIVLSNYSAPSANIVANVIDQLIARSTELNK